MTFIRRAARALELPAHRRLRETIARTREELDTARAAAARRAGRLAALKTRLDRLKKRAGARESALRKTQDDLREALRIQQARVHHLRRLVLSRQALQDTMPRRLQALVSSARVVEAAAREARFMKVSSSYADALAMDETLLREHAAPIVNSGLTWWVPTRAEDPGAPIRRLRRGKLPMHVIQQTRELAVGTIMLDIGGNVGTTSIPRVVLGDFQYVYAAEPEPLNYACLVRTVAANGLRGFVLPDRIAIGSSSGEANLAVHELSGIHHLVAASSEQPFDTVAVPCLSLDDWVRQLGIDVRSIAFVKSDTEGWEPHVLLGAAALLSLGHVIWQVEVSPEHLEAGGYTLPALCDLLAKHFSNFIDMNTRATGERVRAIADLPAALAYLERGEAHHTDVLLFNS